MKTKASTLALLIILTIALPTFLPSASADDENTTATILMDSSTLRTLNFENPPAFRAYFSHLAVSLLDVSLDRFWIPKSLILKPKPLPKSMKN